MYFLSRERVSKQDNHFYRIAGNNVYNKVLLILHCTEWGNRTVGFFLFMKGTNRKILLPEESLFQKNTL